MTAVILNDVRKTFLKGKRVALDNISAEIPAGGIIGIVGPDGAGKTTLMRILAGLMRIDSGICQVWGFSTEDEASRIQESLGYLPQKFGLYEDLTVWQNLEVYANLQGVEKEGRTFDELMEFSGLSPFVHRLAGDLSGGMKQKLGLMATLLRKPKLLLLDEPTLGIDPITQKELWAMISDLSQQGMTIIASTSYLEEAENCHHTLLFSDGRILFRGKPEELKQTVEGRTFSFEGVGDIKRTVLDRLIGEKGIVDAIVEGERINVTFDHANPSKNPEDYDLSRDVLVQPRTPTFEDGFIAKLGGIPKRPALKVAEKECEAGSDECLIRAVGISRNFGSFRAVDNISFEVKKGEIFGLLGPNGAGKSTTFKMMCGLLRPTEGEALVRGVSLRKAANVARSLIGYMAQKFSLYDNMTVMQNLRFFSGIYLAKNRSKSIDEMVHVFNLEKFADTLTVDLPLGYKQRLALSCAIMHQPDVLFLDEPTSGVDPITRREFWHQINVLASSGISIMVSTHLMIEAEYCDRIGLITKGKLRVVDTPESLKKKVPVEGDKEPTLLDAFMYFCSEKVHPGLER